MTAAEALRRDFDLIAQMVPKSARVLDLGCGDGRLLELLRDTRNARIHGIELDFDNVVRCTERDVPVIQADLDDGLAGFPDDGFDLVVLSQTLQVVRKPALVLREMLRVSDRAIISFPNFGHWKVRSYLALHGRMPVSEAIPYSWYDTPNIHHTTLKDFRRFVEVNGGAVESERPLRAAGGSAAKQVRIVPNLLADSAIVVVQRNGKRSGSQIE